MPRKRVSVWQRHQVCSGYLSQSLGTIHRPVWAQGAERRRASCPSELRNWEFQMAEQPGPKHATEKGWDSGQRLSDDLHPPGNLMENLYFQTPTNQQVKAG